MLLAALVVALLAVGSTGCWQGSESGWADSDDGDDDAAADFWEQFWDEVADYDGGVSTGDWYQHCHVKPYLCEDIGDSMAHQNFGCCFGTTLYWCEYDINGEWALMGHECAAVGDGLLCDKGPDGLGCFL
jgi:hypothetical protein